MLDQLKIKNLTNILVNLFSKQRATKTQLVELTGLSNSTVSSSVNSLLKLKLLVCNGMEDSIGGRRSAIYEINKDYGQFLGVDLFKNTIRIVITDCKSNKLNSFTYYLNKEVPVIDQLIQQLQRAAESCVNLLGIGIGLSAEIEYDEQIVKSCTFYDWHNVNLKEIIERQFMVFTYIDHRANGIAVRENLMGHGKHLNNILCLHESAIDKAVLILSGKICRGELNCNGTIDSGFLLKNLSTIKRFVDVSHILIGYCTEVLEIEARQLMRSLGNQIICYPEEQNCIELGMATVAEIEWFESIYFML